MLVEQYRMNDSIMNWSSNALYHGKLVAHPDVKDRVVDELMSKQKLEEQVDSELISQPLVIIDTAGSLMSEGMDEKNPRNGISESKYNNGEADLVIQSVIEMQTDLGLSADNIGIISPYNAQVNLIKKQMRHHLKPN